MKVRVGANSPSLWPTMFSVTSTGTCWRPLCTGDRETHHVRQDHRAARPGLDRPAVVLGRATCTFFARCRSTNGPFFSERGISLTLLLAALDDHAVGALVRAASSCPWSASPTATPGAGCPGRTCPRRRRAGGRPGSSRRRAPSGGCRASASRRPCRRLRRLCSSLPTSPIVARQSTLTLRVSPDLSRRIALTRPRAPRSCAEAPALRASCPPLPGFSSMLWTDRADRDVPQRASHCPRLIGAVGARPQLVAGRDALRREDVAALAVLVEEQRDVRRPVRVVLRALDLARRCRPCRGGSRSSGSMCLWHRALVARRQAADVVAPAGRLVADDECATGPPLCRCERSGRSWKRVPGEVGLSFLSAMLLSSSRRPRVRRARCHPIRSAAPRRGGCRPSSSPAGGRSSARSASPCPAGSRRARCPPSLRRGTRRPRGSPASSPSRRTRNTYWLPSRRDARGLLRDVRRDHDGRQVILRWRAHASFSSSMRSAPTVASTFG